MHEKSGGNRLAAVEFLNFPGFEVVQCWRTEAAGILEGIPFMLTM